MVGQGEIIPYWSGGFFRSVVDSLMEVMGSSGVWGRQFGGCRVFWSRGQTIWRWRGLLEKGEDNLDRTTRSDSFTIICEKALTCVIGAQME